MATAEERRKNLERIKEKARKAGGGTLGGSVSSGSRVQGYTPPPKAQPAVTISRDLRSEAQEQVGSIKRVEYDRQGHPTFYGVRGQVYKPSEADLVKTKTITVKREPVIVKKTFRETPSVQPERVIEGKGFRVEEYTTAQPSTVRTIGGGSRTVFVPKATSTEAPQISQEELKAIRAASALGSHTARSERLGAVAQATAKETEKQLEKEFAFAIIPGRKFKAGARLTKAAKIAKAAAKTRIGKWAIGLGSAEAIAITGPPTARKIGEITAPKDFKGIVGDPRIKEAEKAARAETVGKLRERGIFTSIVSELPFGERLGENVFQKELKKELSSMGFKGADLEKAVKATSRQRTSADIGEAASLLGISGIAEGVGRSLVRSTARRGIQTTKKQLTGTLFRKFAPPIAAAGFIEGASQETAQQQARLREKDLKQQLVMGGLGAGSAGLLGGGIAALRPTKTGISKGIEFGANILDPFEKPGDILADVVGFSSRKITKRPKVSTFVQIPGKREEIVKIGLTGRPKTPIGVITPVPPTKTPTQTLEAIVSRPKPTPTPTPVQIITGTPTGKGKGVPTTQTTFITTEEQVNIPTTANIFTGTAVPTVTPQLRIPPPVPFILPFGTRGTGSKRGKGRKYINELAAGRKLLNRLVGGRR